MTASYPIPSILKAKTVGRYGHGLPPSTATAKVRGGSRVALQAWYQAYDLDP
jgi:hypothetical protein